MPIFIALEGNDLLPPALAGQARGDHRMMNGAAAAGTEQRTHRMRLKPPALPGLYIATGLALVYAGALAALLLGSH